MVQNNNNNKERKKDINESLIENQFISYRIHFLVSLEPKHTKAIHYDKIIKRQLFHCFYKN